MNSNLSRMTATLFLAILAFAASAEGVAPVVCIAPPKAQLGQGNNSATDVSEPVRATLNKYLAGPSVQLLPLEARIPVQIEAEASQKSCNFILVTSVTQTKKTSKVGFLKALAPLASVAFPMLGGAGDVSGMMAGQVASSVMSASAAASAESMQQDYMSAMMGAQQTNVKAGDTLTVEYSLSATGSVGAGKPELLQSKAKQDGEDVIGPLLEQVAVAVLSVVTAV